MTGRPTRRRALLAALAAAGALALQPAQSLAEADGTRERIVSVGGSITEILYALGMQDSIVAVDTTSLYPPAATKKPNVGYVRALAAEPIIALAPSLVIAEGDAGPPAVLDQIRDAGIRLVLGPKEPTIAATFRKVALVAEAVGREAEGAHIAAAMRRDLEAVARAVGTVKARPRVLFLLSVGRGSPLAGGSRTSADTIIGLAGGTNAAAAFDRYKPIPPEGVVAAAPEVILITGRTAGLMGGVDKLRARSEVAATPAGRNGRIVTMNGLLLLGFGPRVGQAARELAGKLHPGLSVEAR